MSGHDDQAPLPPELSGAKQEDRDQAGRWKAGVSGNSAGRPRGTRSRIAGAVEAILGNRTVALAEKAVAMALSGDTVMLRACLDRLAPPRRAEVVVLDLPLLRTPADALEAASALVAAVAAGEVSPAEAGEVVKLLEAFGRVHAAVEFEDRLAALEEKLA